MSKKEFNKRAGQIYALGIQQGFDEKEMMRYLNESFLFLYNKNRQREIEENIEKANYTENRYKIDKDSWWKEA